MKMDFTSSSSKVLDIDGFQVRAWEGITYCEKPVSPVQRLNLYAPESYFHDGTLNGYDVRTAPVFCPNTVGGYLEGPPLSLTGPWFWPGPDVVIAALKHGYVVVCVGIRGRNSSCGHAPALIIDMKASIRLLRHNRIPGNTDRIVTSGTSAGGALSALAGATGNHPDYEPFLREIGAAEERDDVFAANCYCPIHNLENADTAYEWMFGDEGLLTSEQREVSFALRKLFPAYVNSLGLSDENGRPLRLKAAGSGSFLDYIAGEVVRSARVEETRALAEGSFLLREGRQITGIDWQTYIHTIGRMKSPPAFDKPDLSSWENDEFGGKHFAAFSVKHDHGNRQADPGIIKMMNPTHYIGKADTAPHWRIRHGTCDRDTSLAIPVILSLLLKKSGYDVDFLLPWGMPHCGDYDLDKMFDWIDGLCQGRIGTDSKEISQ